MLKIRSLLVPYSILLLCLCWGCGTGDYEARLDKNLGDLKKGSKFNELNPAQELPDSKVSIRIPNIFQGPPLPETTEDRRKNPMLLPGLKLTYEAAIEDKEHGFLPYYCYVGISGLPASQVELNLPSQYTIQNFAVIQWAPFSAKTAEGRETQWKKLRVTGDMEFNYKTPNGQERYQKMPGILEIYLYQEPGAPVVIIAWRMPANIEGPLQVNLDKWAALIAGSVTVQP
jgi:hypothetical protein